MKVERRMNVDLIRRVAARIRDLEYVDSNVVYDASDGIEGFDMSSIAYSCGAPACIAGWTLVEGGEPEGIGIGCRSATHRAARLLGLKPWQGRALLMPEVGETVYWAAAPGEREFITAEHAARCMEHLARTGAVDWEGTRP